jgi:hypothetical protein
MFNQLDRLSDYKDAEWTERTKSKRNNVFVHGESRRRAHVRHPIESTDLYMEHEHYEDLQEDLV